MGNQSTIDVDDAKPCTCHPDDNSPTPCPHRYAFRDCVAASTPLAPKAVGRKEVARIIERSFLRVLSDWNGAKDEATDQILALIHGDG